MKVDYERGGCASSFPLSAFILLMGLTGCTLVPSAPTATPTPLVPTPIPGALYVNADQPIGPISPYVFGTNYGPWMFLSWAHGPQQKKLASRCCVIPAVSGAISVDLMEYQIDEAVALAKELGAEPLISVRLANGSIENADNLVKYANQTKKYNIKYWSIGNESNLYVKRSDGIAGL